MVWDAMATQMTYKSINSILTNLPNNQIDKLQRILRTSARLVLKLPKHSHLTNQMHNKLHWLHYPYRIQFKLNCFVFKCLKQQAPSYLNELIKPLIRNLDMQLRSAQNNILYVPKHTTKYGKRAFAVAGPSAWNSLPLALRNTDITLLKFKQMLKTYYFNLLWIIDLYPCNFILYTALLR